MPYEHTQIGYLMAGLFFAAACIAVAIGAIWPSARVSFVIGILLLLTVVFFHKLTVQIDNETLRAWFGPGLITKKVRMADIASCEPIRIRWWYGWGIHLTPYGWLYNIAGWDAVAIRLRDRRTFALGTDDPQGLAAAIRRFASAK